MKKNLFLAVAAVLLVSGTWAFAQQGKLNADHKEFQQHYSSCTRIINEIRDAEKNPCCGVLAEPGVLTKTRFSETLTQLKNQYWNTARISSAMMQTSCAKI